MFLYKEVKFRHPLWIVSHIRVRTSLFRRIIKEQENKRRKYLRVFFFLVFSKKKKKKTKAEKNTAITKRGKRIDKHKKIVDHSSPDFCITFRKVWVLDTTFLFFSNTVRLTQSHSTAIDCSRWYTLSKRKKKDALLWWCICNWQATV